MRRRYRRGGTASLAGDGCSSNRVLQDGPEGKQIGVVVENDGPIDSRYGLQNGGRQPQSVLIAQEVMKPPFNEALVTGVRRIGAQQVLGRDQLMRQGGIVQHHEKRAPPILGKVQCDGEQALRRRLVWDGLAPQSVAL